MPKSKKKSKTRKSTTRARTTKSAGKRGSKTTSSTARRSKRGAKRGTERREKQSPRDKPRAERGRPADQIGAIFSKGLDLAEAGLSLGLTMVTRMGEVAQQSVSRIAGVSVSPEGPGPTPHAPIDDRHDAAPPGQAAGPPPEDTEYFITNRLPLTPGGSCRISFSINNDSMDAPKRAALRVEGFVGEAEGARFDPDGLAVRPASKTIAPMDFEKFVLEGAVPPEVPQDVYLGAVVVKSGSEFRIPVRLVAL
jgi:hypothetical protein